MVMKDLERARRDSSHPRTLGNLAFGGGIADK